jgi:glucokinase
MSPTRTSSRQGSPPDGGDFLLGIDFGGTKVALAVARPTGEILARDRVATTARRGADQVVQRVLVTADTLISKGEQLSGGRCVAVGAVSPGIVLPDRILLAPNVPGWGDLHLAELLQDGLGGRPIAVGTDTKAGALAEWRWGSLARADPAIFISLGTGIAAAIVVGGRVLTGAHGAAGEIAYNLRGVTARGGWALGLALEQHVGGRALGLRGEALLGRPITTQELFHVAESDRGAATLVSKALDELAVHVANLAVAIDPARIAVGGGWMKGSAEMVLSALGHGLKQTVPFPPELVAAHFLVDAPLRGAIALAVDACGAGTGGR